MRYLRGETPLELSMVRSTDLPSSTLSGSGLWHLRSESLNARELMLGTSDRRTELSSRDENMLLLQSRVER
jgi:hypothetical protein